MFICEYGTGRENVNIRKEFYYTIYKAGQRIGKKYYGIIE